MMISIDVRRIAGNEAGTTILEIACGSGSPDDVFTRFVRAKVSLEILLPSTSILELPSDARSAAPTLRWRLKTADCTTHLALVRATLDLLDLPYCDAETCEVWPIDSLLQSGDKN